MKKIFFFFFLCLWVYLVPGKASADIRIEIKLEKAETYVHDEVKMLITVYGVKHMAEDPVVDGIEGLQFIRMGKFRDFEVVGMNATMVHMLKFVYRIRASREGEFFIGPARVKIDKDTYESNTIKLVVSDKPIETGKERGPGFLTTTLSKRECYVEEQLFYTVRLYHQFSAWYQLPGLPEVEGLRFIQLGNPIKFQRIYNEKSYHVAEFRYALFPSRAGDFRIPPPRMEVKKSVLSSMSKKMNLSKQTGKSRDVNGGNREIYTGDVMRLKVSPLPVEGRPEEFAGLVGQFDIHAGLEPLEITRGKPATLTVQIKGRGNVNYISDLTLPEMEYVKTYAEVPVFNMEKNPDGVKGSKIMKWVVVAGREGLYSIPPFSIHYFNPELGKYVQSETASPMLTVHAIPGIIHESIEEQNAKSSAGGNDKGEGGTNQDILTIHNSLVQLSKKPLQLPRGFFFWLILGLPAFACCLTYGVIYRLENKNRDSARIKARRSFKTLMRKLQEADISANDLAMAICGYLNDRFSLSMGSLTATEAQNILLSNGVSTRNADKFRHIFNRIEEAIYTGGFQEYRDIREEMLGLIREIEKELP